MTTDSQKEAVQLLMRIIQATPPQSPSLVSMLALKTAKDLLDCIRDLERDESRYRQLFEKHKQDSAEHLQRWKTAETVVGNLEKDVRVLHEKLVILERSKAALEDEFDRALALLKLLWEDGGRSVGSDADDTPMHALQRFLEGRH